MYVSLFACQIMAITASCLCCCVHVASESLRLSILVLTSYRNKLTHTHLKITNKILFVADGNVRRLTHVVTAVKPLDQISSLRDDKDSWGNTVHCHNVTCQQRSPCKIKNSHTGNTASSFKLETQDSYGPYYRLYLFYMHAFERSMHVHTQKHTHYTDYFFIN